MDNDISIDVDVIVDDIYKSIVKPTRDSLKRFETLRIGK